jgi:hypothetical protein
MSAHEGAIEQLRGKTACLEEELEQEKACSLAIQEEREAIFRDMDRQTS